MTKLNKCLMYSKNDNRYYNMKNLIIFFLLVSNGIFSQNYHYALDEAPTDADTGVNIPVVVILGQSNADGGAFNVDFSESINTFYSSNHPNLKIYYKPAVRNNNNGISIDLSSLVDDGEWWELTNGHDATNKKTLQSIGLPASTVAFQSTQTHGPESAMGKWWEENYPGEELRIIKFGVGATSLQDNWLPNGGLYDTFMQYVYEPAIADIIAEGNTVDLIGVYWNQGETDTTDERAPNYETNLQTLISNFRSDSGIVDARFVVSQLNAFTNTANWNTVKTAQANVAATDNNVDLIITDGSGIEAAYNTNPSDGIHFSSSGQTQLSDAFWGIIYPAQSVTNMIDEIAYFDCYLLPLALKDQFQEKLNEYGCVRLEKGDYGYNNNESGTPITITNKQSIYGHPETTRVPNIIVEAGSTNVHLESLQPFVIDFNAGGPITNSLFKNIKYATLRTTGGMLENNLFVNLNSAMYFDMSASGYYRNNRVIRHQVHGPIALHLQGNNTTPSFGNVHTWSNYLTPIAEGAILENMGDFTFIGLDSEGWNFRNEQTFGAMFYASGMGSLKMSDFIGGADYSTDGQPAWLIDADNLLFFGKSIWTQSSIVQNTALNDTNVLAIDDNGAYNVTSGTDARAFTSNSSVYDKDSFYYGGVKQIATITDVPTINSIKDIILDTQHTPYPKYVHEILPDPLGANWATERIGKPDSRDYIQGLIDTNNVAELPEGIFYIGSSLNLNSSPSTLQGIIGQGTGKTVICGLTDDFPLISVNNPDAATTQGSISLSYLTLQGGSKGLLLETDIRLFAFNVWKYVVFRNQNIGIHVDKIFGLDNNIFDHLSFVDCGTGFLNDYVSFPGTSDQVEYQNWLDNELGYVDKTVFYKSQFINNGVGCQIRSFRASNLNLWQDCLFDGNGLAANVIGNRHSLFVNSEFKNNSGNTDYDAVIACGDLSLYSCDFYNNTSAETLYSGKIYMEGCNLLDNIPFNDSAFDQTNYIYNSVINGFFRGGWLENAGVYVNSTFAQNPELSKLLLIEYDDPNAGRSENDILQTIIDEPSNPYPQLYVKH